jgi:uncharacterized membrane protein YqjE
MADQTSVEYRNGSGEAPASQIVRNLGDCAHDVVVLAELQARLAALDLKESAQQTLAPAGLLAIGLGLLAGSFPVLLMTLAYLLINVAEWPEWAGFLLATVIGFLVGGALCAGAYWLFRSSVTGLERSRKELTDNLRWLKEVLSASGRSRHRRQCD